MAAKKKTSAKKTSTKKATGKPPAKKQAKKSASTAKKQPEPAATPLSKADKKTSLLYCSFCGKSTRDVNSMISGPGVNICDVCARMSVDMAKARQSDEKAGQDENEPGKSGCKYIYQLVRRHFAPLDTVELMTSIREFPLRMRADLQKGLEELFGECDDDEFTGLNKRYDRDGLGFADLLQDDSHPVVIAPATFDEIDIGEELPVRCLTNGLWLMEFGSTRYCALMSLKREFGGGGSVKVEIAVPPGEAGSRIISQSFKYLESTVNNAGAYRGKVISLERENPYSGESSEIIVHRLPVIEAEDIILPVQTLTLVNENIIDFNELKPEIKELGMSVKKGVLFYGPPGTGKTHTVKYIANTLTEYTTLLVSADEVVNLAEYMVLARLLQPAVVVVEDVDLIAKERSSMSDAGVESLLNRLLNEMDGLKENNDVLFILTTNRPDVLEEALIDRPGRVDQVIEFPLPDGDSRKRLAQLYAKNLQLPDELRDLVVEKTENVSPAFIKELMRRIAQNLILDQASDTVNEAHINGALEDMLFASGKLNRSILGGRH